MPDIDVIIPLHNKLPFIEQAIRSALAQTLPPRTVIVFDDASTDGSAEKVEAIRRVSPEVVLLKGSTEAPAGAASARNRAIQHSSAEFIAFLDADDWWEKNKLARQIAPFADSQIGLVHCGCNYYSPSGQFLFVLPPDPMTAPDELYDRVRLGTYWVTG